VQLAAKLRLTVALVFFVAHIRAAEDPSNVLAHCKSRILERAERLPNYTCHETVDRRYFRTTKPVVPAPECGQLRNSLDQGGLKLELDATDRVRLEVKVSGGLEIGSWPGASQFDSRSIFELAGGGAFGTGPLGTLLTDVFVNDGTTFVFAGEQDKLLVYRYDVPLSASHYYIQAWGSWRPVAFDGRVWIEPATFDLKRIESHTHELPPESHACYATTTVDYDRLGNRPHDFLAPAKSALQFLMRNGATQEIDTVYSRCREYQVESTLRFDDAPLEPAVQAAAKDSGSVLSAGLAVSLVFTSPIDTSTAAAGDVVGAQTRKAVLDPQSGRVLIPAGAPVELRITTMRHEGQSPRYFLISLLLERYQADGVWSPLSATLDLKDQGENIRRMMSLRGASISLPTGRQSALVTTLYFPASGERYVVPRGFKTNWVTVSPAKK
jgi:hypothetical protein